MEFEQPLPPQESQEERNKKKFIESLTDKLAEMQQSGRLSQEQVDDKLLAASKIQTGFSDDLEHDAEIFVLSGIADEEEMIKAFEGRKDVENQTKEKETLTGPDTDEPSEEQIANLEQEKKEISEGLKQIREDTGLPQVDEEPDSVKSINDQIEKINTNETKAEAEKKEFELEKQHCLKVLDATKNLTNIFNKRNGDRLSPLLDDGSLGRLKSAITNIDDLTSQKKVDIDSFDIELAKIASSINSIGDMPRKLPLKEDVQSLGALIFRLKNLKEEGGNLIRFISKFNSEQTEKTRKNLHNLCDSCDKKWPYIARLRESLDRYSR